MKFLVDSKVAKKLRSRMRKMAADGGKPKTKALRSIYYDTKDQALFNAGFSVRLRKDGAGWIQTVKTRSAVKNGLSTVGEYECEVPKKKLRLKAIPKKSARRAVKSLTKGKTLKPVYETAMARMSSIVSDGNGTLAEMSVDKGKIIAGNRSAKFSEAELELRQGEVASLYRLADDLLSSQTFSFSRLSKSDRGHLLAREGRIRVEPVPRRAVKVALESDQSAISARRDVFGECLNQISTNIEAVQNSDDPEGPHQLRIGLRRLRSALPIFAPITDREDIRYLRREAKWLGQKVGVLRDCDVAIVDIIRQEAEAHPDEPGFRALDEALLRKTARARKKVRKLLGKRRVQKFLLNIARVCETRAAGSLAPVTGDLVQSQLGHCWDLAYEHGHDIENLTTDQRHELRKDLKRLRYAVEFAAPLYPGKSPRKFTKRLKALQSIFGELNDAAMIGDLLSDNKTGDFKDNNAQRAIGLVIGSRLAKAHEHWDHARELWSGLVEAERFWETGG